MIRCEGRITIATGGWAITVTEQTPNAGPETVTIPAGDYYWTTTNGANAALTTTIGNALTANGTLTGTYTVSLATSSTGQSTISMTGPQKFTATFGSTELRDALGFAGNLVFAANTHISEYQATYLWLSTVHRCDPMAPEPPSVS